MVLDFKNWKLFDFRNYRDILDFVMIFLTILFCKFLFYEMSGMDYEIEDLSLI